MNSSENMNNYNQYFIIYRILLAVLNDHIMNFFYISVKCHETILLKKGTNTCTYLSNV